MVRTPLIDFNFAAWEYARFGRADFLLKAETKNYIRLGNSYSILHILQRKIQDRDLYRLLSEGKSNYSETMRILDSDILSKLDYAQKIIWDAQVYLDSIHKWKVRGGGFSIENGQVIDQKS